MVVTAKGEQTYVIAAPPIAATSGLASNSVEELPAVTTTVLAPLPGPVPSSLDNTFGAEPNTSVWLALLYL